MNEAKNIEEQEDDVEGHSATVRATSTFEGKLPSILDTLEKLSARIVREDGLEFPSERR